jgi:dipeptidyl aminopeptidase/acylaminoacyl peptidase
MNRVPKFVFFILGCIVGAVAIVVVERFVPGQSIVGGITDLPKAIERPLDAYTIESLRLYKPDPNPIVLEDVVATGSGFFKQKFSFTVSGKRVSGLMHIPLGPESRRYPAIVQFRGYVDPTIYKPGIGTERSAEVFAQNGFVSIAPDFLGYGSSDYPSTDVFEERFETYTTALSLLSSVGTIPFVDGSRVGIWGHSNGGHIALDVLAITGKPYPTSLWAPVTKPFPYSILYFTDEYDDGGYLLRQKLARFEVLYDPRKYTFTSYLQSITAPIHLHQGTADEAVPVSWSRAFVKSMKDIDKNITYYEYPDADHNMVGSWNTVVGRDVAFFTRSLTSQ